MEGEKKAMAEEVSGNGGGIGLLRMKLRRVATGKRASLRTPVRLQAEHSLSGGIWAGELSARKLGARLWELQDMPSLPQMRRRMAVRRFKHELVETVGPHDFSSPNSSERPQTASNLTRQTADSYVENFNFTRNTDDQQPRTPASYSSSIEESKYWRKATAEQLKALNRIWSLEERYACSMPLIKALKVELSHALSRVQEMMQMQRVNYHEVVNLRTEIVENELTRMNEEQENTEAAVLNEELERERKLRRRSDYLHHKVSKELSEEKSACSKVMKDLDEQIITNVMLEELCDEFARGVGEYEQELNDLRHHFDRKNGYCFDPLMLQISETWLEKRLHMRISENHSDLVGKAKTIDRLRAEIMIFLQTRSTKSINVNAPHKGNNKGSILCRQIVESVQLNGNGSSPQDAADDYSLSTDFNCSELKTEVNKIHELHGQLGEERARSEDPEKSNLSNIHVIQRKANNHYSCCLPAHSDQLQADKITLLNANKMEVMDDPAVMQSVTGNDSVFVEGNQIKAPELSNLLSVQDQGRYIKKDKVIDNIIDSLSAADKHDMCDHFLSTRPSPNENSLKAKLHEARLEGKNACWNVKLCSIVK